MPKFIDTTIDGERILINVDHIRAVTFGKDGSLYIVGLATPLTVAAAHAPAILAALTGPEPREADLSLSDEYIAALAWNDTMKSWPAWTDIPRHQLADYVRFVAAVRRIGGTRG